MKTHAAGNHMTVNPAITKNRPAANPAAVRNHSAVNSTVAGLTAAAALSLAL